MTNPFSLAQYRPLTLWGGPGTRRLLRLTFPGSKVDDKAHDMAHSIEGAEKVAALGFNWVQLVFSWGFAPEIEAGDWESFRSAVQHYHRAGIRVMGCIQASNCVYQGSYTNRDWYALDAKGHKIYCFTGRFYTSLLNSTWQDEIRARIQTLVETEADGIYFDNPWQGGIGHDIAEMPLGPIGSYDEHSRAAYARAFGGAEIPLILDVRQPEVQQYLRWRAETAISVLQKWIDVARTLNPSLAISANNFDAIARNSYVAMGMDLAGQADIQNVATVEAFSWPRIRENDTVVANAITIGAAQARCGKVPVSTKPYEHGIGFERMWPAHEFRRTIAESIAMNAPLVMQGTGFRYQGAATLLLNSRYDSQQRTLGEMNNWLEKNGDWISARQPTTPLAVYHPYEAARWHWNEVSPLFFAACETLLLNGYPLRIVGDDDDWTDVKCVLVPPGQVDGLEERLQRFQAQGGKVIPLGQKRTAVTPAGLWDGWQPIRSRIPTLRFLRRYLNQGAGICWRLYHERRLARWLAQRMGIQEALTQSPIYIKPPQPFQQALLEAIGRDFTPRVESEGAVLLTAWREPDGTQQWHLVNYMDSPQKVILHLDNLTAARVYTPGSQETPPQVVGTSLMFTIEAAKIVRAFHAE